MRRMAPTVDPLALNASQQFDEMYQTRVQTVAQGAVAQGAVAQGAVARGAETPAVEATHAD